MSPIVLPEAEERVMPPKTDCVCHTTESYALEAHTRLSLTQP